MTDSIQPNSFTQEPLPLISAQLWIGPDELLVTKAQKYVQSVYCTKNKCNVCVTCRQIFDKQHHAVIWFCPEKQYTIDLLEPIFKTITFALDENKHFFFILQKADFLTPTCANSLLKSMEEPPAGYHFILLANRSEQILPTIRSRCMMQSFADVAFTQPTDLFDFFSTTTYCNPAAFLKELDQSKINERQTTELLDMLFAYWLDKYKQALIAQDKKLLYEADRVLAIFQQTLCQPVMPGSSKIFWRNLFLQMQI